VARRRFGVIVAWWEPDTLCHRLFRADLKASNGWQQIDLITAELKS
jgi:hypothetical protein